MREEGVSAPPGQVPGFDGVLHRSPALISLSQGRCCTRLVGYVHGERSGADVGVAPELQPRVPRRETGAWGRGQCIGTATARERCRGELDPQSGDLEAW